MRSTVPALSRSGLLKAKETAVLETPASLATSAMWARLVLTSTRSSLVLGPAVPARAFVTGVRTLSAGGVAVNVTRSGCERMTSPPRNRPVAESGQGGAATCSAARPEEVTDHATGDDPATRRRRRKSLGAVCGRAPERPTPDDRRPRRHRYPPGPAGRDRPPQPCGSAGTGPRVWSDPRCARAGRSCGDRCCGDRAHLGSLQCAGTAARQDRGGRLQLPGARPRAGSGAADQARP